MHYIFCPHCGQKVQSNAPFCPHCGFKLNSNVTYNNQRLNNNSNTMTYPSKNYETFHQHKNKFLSIIGAALVILMIGCYLFYRHTIPTTLKNHTIKGSSNFIPMSADGSSHNGQHSPEEYFDDEAIFGEYTETESDFYDEYDSDDEFSEEDSSDASDQTSDSDSNNDSDSDSNNSDSNNSDSDSNNSDNSNDNSGTSDNSGSDSGGSGASDDSYKLHRHTPYFLENLGSNHNIHNKLSYRIGAHTITLHIQLGKMKATAHYKINHVYRYNNNKVYMNVTGTNKYSKNTSFTFDKFSKDHCVVKTSSGSHHSTQRFDGSGVSFSK